nr:1,4-beta-xylanase [Arthrobacter sp. 35W]
MTWGWVGTRGTWSTPEAAQSMQAMAALNVNWATIAFQAVQSTAHTTDINFTSDQTVSDNEVRWAIRKAKALGMKVCLKPVINCADGTWRAFIGFFDQDVPNEPSWREWFENYTRFLAHYAKIAEEEGCELFCIGCEMVQTDHRETEWREAIGNVRAVFSGPVTYNCDKYQEDRLTWWDAVDVISSSGYYPMGSWAGHLDRIEAVVRQHNKPFLFLEAGCPARQGSPARPNDWSLEGAPSEQAQFDYYQDMLTHTLERPWVGGFMLWDWPALLYPVELAARDADYCIYGKSASALVADAYAKSTASTSEGSMP